MATKQELLENLVKATNEYRDYVFKKLAEVGSADISDCDDPLKWDGGYGSTYTLDKARWYTDCTIPYCQVHASELNGEPFDEWFDFFQFNDSTDLLDYIQVD